MSPHFTLISIQPTQFSPRESYFDHWVVQRLWTKGIIVDGNVRKKPAEKTQSERSAKVNGLKDQRDQSGRSSMKHGFKPTKFVFLYSNTTKISSAIKFKSGKQSEHSWSMSIFSHQFQSKFVTFRILVIFLLLLDFKIEHTVKYHILENFYENLIVWKTLIALAWL